MNSAKLTACPTASNAILVYSTQHAPLTALTHDVLQDFVDGMSSQLSSQDSTEVNSITHDKIIISAHLDK